MRYFLFIFIFATFGCASEEKKGPGYLPSYDYSANSTAHSASYGADIMMLQRPMPSSAPGWQPKPFFFKKCNEAGERFYFSKTSYDCTYP